MCDVGFSAFPPVSTRTSFVDAAMARAGFVEQIVLHPYVG